MNNANNWLLAIAIVVLLGGTAWWLYGSDDSANTNTNNPTTTNTPDTTTTVPSSKLTMAISDTDWTSGPADAQIQIVEYADFECPACKGLSPGFKTVAAQFPDQVSFTYRHFPLSYHALAMPGAQIAEAAGAQGKFWEMSKYMFGNQFSVDSAYGHAASLGLDIERMKSEIEAGTYDEKINKDYVSGQESGVPGTPSLFLNGELLEWEKTQDLTGTINSILSQ